MIREWRAMIDTPIHQEARYRLRRALNYSQADFHPDQWEAIAALVQQRQKLLVAQCTG